MIKIVDRMAYIPEYERVIGCVNDNLVEMREFYVYDSSLSDFNFKLSLKNPDGSENVIDLEKEVSSDAIILKWEIERAHLKGAGIMPAQLYATKSEGDDILKWHTLNILNFEVNISIPEGEAFESMAPSEIEQLEERITTAKNEAQQAAADALEAGTAALCAKENAEALRDEAIVAAERAEGAAVKTPYIGENGNWFVWNDAENTFVDSETAAQLPVSVKWQEEEISFEGLGVSVSNREDGTITNKGANKLLGLILGREYSVIVNYYKDGMDFENEYGAVAKPDKDGNPCLTISDGRVFERIEICDKTALSIQNKADALSYTQCTVYTEEEFDYFSVYISGTIKRPVIGYLPGFYISEGTRQAIRESVINSLQNGDEVEY